VELESFMPQRLIGILNRGIANSQKMDLSENSNLILLEDNYSGYVCSSDSFG
jgi:hypothetical protein